MGSLTQQVVWFSDIGKDSLAFIGQKAFSLATLSRLGLPVPPAFIVSSIAYTRFLQESELFKSIDEKLALLSVKDSEALEKVAKEIQEAILAQPMSETLQEEICEAYDALNVDPTIRGTKAEALVSSGRDLPFVAVRSSLVGEDVSLLSGQQASYLQMRGKKQVLAAIKACWASLFTPRAIYSREKHSHLHKHASIAVIVQKMVSSEVSGLMYSSDSSSVLVEASYGLGDVVASGELSCDTYYVDKKSLEMSEKMLAEKSLMYVYDPQARRVVKVAVPEDKQHLPCLSAYELRHLAAYAAKVEEKFGALQKVSFALAKTKIALLGMSSYTPVKKEERVVDEKKEGLSMHEADLLLSGKTSSTGVGKGSVVFVRDVFEASKVKEGDVMVARAVREDYLPAIARASALIVDSDAFSVDLRLALDGPCVYAVDSALQKLKEGQFVTVDANKGRVYSGDVLF